MSQSAACILVGLVRFWNDAAHVDKAMNHPTVNFKIDFHARHAQHIGIGHTLIDQRITFCQTDPGRCKTVMPLCKHGGEAPIVSVLGINVVVKKPINGGFVEHEAMLVGVV